MQLYTYSYDQFAGKEKKIVQDSLKQIHNFSAPRFTTLISLHLFLLYSSFLISQINQKKKLIYDFNVEYNYIII